MVYNETPTTESNAMYLAYLKNQSKARATNIKNNLTKEKLVFVAALTTVTLAGAAYTHSVIKE